MCSTTWSAWCAMVLYEKLRPEKRKLDYEKEWTITDLNANLEKLQMYLIDTVTAVGPIVERSPISEYAPLWSYGHQTSCLHTRKCYMEGNIQQLIRENTRGHHQKKRNMVNFVYPVPRTMVRNRFLFLLYFCDPYELWPQVRIPEIIEQTQLANITQQFHVVYVWVRVTLACLSED